MKSWTMGALLVSDTSSRSIPSSSTAILEMEPMDHEARSLATTKDFEYAYYIDIDADEIVTLDISADGTSVEEIGRTALPRDGMDTLAVSASGMNIIAYDADNASALAVMRAIR